jgi:hypothetical protein
MHSEDAVFAPNREFQKPELREGNQNLTAEVARKSRERRGNLATKEHE